MESLWIRVNFCTGCQIYQSDDLNFDVRCGLDESCSNKFVKLIGLLNHWL